MYYKYTYDVNGWGETPSGAEGLGAADLDESQGAGRCDQDQEQDPFKAFARAYKKLPNMTQRAELTYYLKTIDKAVVLECIEESKGVRFPSWAYARAILNRLMDEGVKTEEQYLARQSRWIEQQEKKRRMQVNPHKVLEEREVSEKEFENGFYADIMNRKRS